MQVNLSQIVVNRRRIPALLVADACMRKGCSASRRPAWAEDHRPPGPSRAPVPVGSGLVDMSIVVPSLIQAQRYITYT